MSRGGVRRARLGVVISPENLAAVEIRRGLRGARARRTWIRQLEPYAGGADWPDLTDALEELASEIGACGALCIAFTRPLARSKVVSPPPVAVRDVVPLVVRNVRRYMVAGTGPLLTDAVRLRNASDGGNRAILACVSAALAQAVWESAQAAGWRVEVMTTATVALIQGASRLLPERGRARATLVASCAYWREAVVVENGEPVSVEGWTQLSASECRGRASELARQSGGIPVMLEDPSEGGDGKDAEDRAETGFHPAAAAAFGVAALQTRPPLFLPDAELARRARRSKRRTMVQAAAAFLLLVSSQQIHVAGLQRELAAVRAERSAIAPAVHSALAIRASAESLSRQLHTIDIARESTWRWSPVVAALASELPDSVYLLSLSGRGAELHLTGVAPSASAVIPALASSRLFASVALESPVERVPQSGEKFELGANVAPRASTAREVKSDSLRKRTGS